MLRFNDKNRSFVLYTTDRAKAEEVGLTLSNLTRGPNGEDVYYTAAMDNVRSPIFNPFAALPFFDEADAKTKEILEPYQREYLNSWALSGQKTFPKAAHQPNDYLPFQKAGIEYGVSKGNVLIGDEPGLGKTIQAIAIANATEAKSVLVVCPASIRLNWEREVKYWSSMERPQTFVFQNSKKNWPKEYGWVISSYELTRNKGIHDAICARNWDTLIIDEAHYLKSTDAKRTQAVFGAHMKGHEYFEQNIAKKVGQIIALTGTPLPNRPRECYTLARALNWESIGWMSYADFEHKYNPSGVTDSGHTLEKKGRLPELQNRLRCNFMIRRHKADVLKDLPDKRYELTYVEPNGAIKDVLAKEKLINFSIDDLKDPRAEIFGMISTVRREMGEAKVPRVIEHVRYLLDFVEIPKIVLFAHHKSVMNHLAHDLESFGVVQVRGGMTSKAKDQAVQDFRFDKRVRIFLGQMDAAGFGIDGLQDAASHVVFAEPAWVPGTNEQAVDRCHRIGQHANVLAQFLVVEGSFDERILAAVLGKTHTIHATLDKRFW